MRRMAVAICIGSVVMMAGKRWSFRSASAERPEPVNLSGFGAPLSAILNNSTDLETFSTGQSNFKEIDQVPQLGPVFNGVSCAACHSQPAIGGAGLFINELRVRNNRVSGPVHILPSTICCAWDRNRRVAPTYFPPGVQAEPIGCQLTAPRAASSPLVKSKRRSKLPSSGICRSATRPATAMPVVGTAPSDGRLIRCLAWVSSRRSPTRR